MHQPTPSTGAELTEWRLAHGWSMRELAVRLRVHASSVSRAERRPERRLGERLRGEVARLRRASRRPWSVARCAPGAADEVSAATGESCA